MAIYCELEIHFYEILAIGRSYDPAQHYNFFRKRLKGSVPEAGGVRRRRVELKA